MLRIGVGVGVCGGGPWSPASVPGAYVFSHADAGAAVTGSGVSRWDDLTGNGRHWTQGTDASRPPLVTSGFGGRNAIKFDGVADFLTGASLAALTAGEVFLAVQAAADPGVAGKTGLWRMGVNAGSDAHYPFTDGVIYDDWGSSARKTTVNPTPSLASPRIYNVISTATEWTSNLDGAQIFTTATNTITFHATPWLGKGPAVFLDGWVRAIAIYSSKLSASDRASVLAWFKAFCGVA